MRNYCYCKCCTSKYFKVEGNYQNRQRSLVLTAIPIFLNLHRFHSDLVEPVIFAGFYLFLIYDT